MPLAAGDASAGLLFLFGGALFVLVPAIILAVQRRTKRRRQAWAARALRVPGDVLDVRWRADPNPIDGIPETRAYPTLRYTPPGGSTVEVESFEGASPPVARAGDAVTVLIDPEDHRRARVDGDGLAGKVVPAILGCLTVGLGLVGAVLMAVGVVLLTN